MSIQASALCQRHPRGQNGSLIELPAFTAAWVGAKNGRSSPHSLKANVQHVGDWTCTTQHRNGVCLWGSSARIHIFFREHRALLCAYAIGRAQPNSRVLDLMMSAK